MESLKKNNGLCCLCFRYLDSTIPLLPKYKIASL